MKHKNKTLSELFLRYDSKRVAAKMLRDISRATPQEIGRALLAKNLLVPLVDCDKKNKKAV